MKLGVDDYITKTNSKNMVEAVIVAIKHNPIEPLICENDVFIADTPFALQMVQKNTRTSSFILCRVFGLTIKKGSYKSCLLNN